jgi:hypothetical protein
MRLLRLVALGAAMLLAMRAYAQAPGGIAEPLGMIIDVQGAVTLVQSGRRARVEMLSYVRPRMEIELGSGASLALTWYASSKELRFSGPAHLKVQGERIETVKGARAKERSLGEDKIALGQQGLPARLSQAAIQMRNSRPLHRPTPEQAVRQEKLKPDASAAFSDWVLYALALEDMGLTAEARRVWKDLAAQRPDDPQLRDFAAR